MANLGYISGELRSGPAGRQSPPWELSRAFPPTAPFLQGQIYHIRQDAHRRKGACQRSLHPSFGSGKAGARTVPFGGEHRGALGAKVTKRPQALASGSGLRPTWEGIPVGLLTISVTLG